MNVKPLPDFALYEDASLEQHTYGKQKVMDMSDGPTFNQPFPTEEDIVAEVYGSRDIRPCYNKIESVPCPCGKHHLLHTGKEPLSEYRGAVWGTTCAIKDLFSYMEQSIGVLTKQRDHAESMNRGFEKRMLESKNLMYAATQVMTLREEHMMDCNAIDPIKQVRGGANSICNCGLPTFKNIREKCVQFLNGRGSEIESEDGLE